MIYIEQTSWEQNAHSLKKIRHTVFVDEQNVPKHLELDEYDQIAFHFLAYYKDKGSSQFYPVGCCRLQQNGKIGRMAVLSSHRNRQIGSALLNAVEKLAIKMQLNEIHLDAQEHAIPFYERHGFFAEGEFFLDADIQHLRMRKKLMNRITT